MVPPTISNNARTRLALYVESRCASLGTAIAAETPDDLAAERVATDLLSRFAHELAVGDRDVVERRLDATAPVPRASLVRQAFGTLGAWYVRDAGFDREALAYVVARAADLSQRAAENARPPSEADRPDATAHLAAASGAVVAAFDPALGEHARAIGTWSARLVRAAGGEPGDQRAARDVATIGDLGKLTLPHALLVKRERLDPQDWATIRAVPAVGAAIAERMPLVTALAPSIVARRERYDGRGLAGLAGEQIPVLARVVAVADAFHAMISDRPYRPRLEIDAAISELQRGAGSLFDGHIVAELVELVRPAAVARPKLRAINGGAQA